jgi:hypothetical protein
MRVKYSHNIDKNLIIMVIYLAIHSPWVSRPWFEDIGDRCRSGSPAHFHLLQRFGYKEMEIKRTNGESCINMQQHACVD